MNINIEKQNMLLYHINYINNRNITSKVVNESIYEGCIFFTIRKSDIFGEFFFIFIGNILK